jgi:hypothetical protein
MLTRNRWKPGDWDLPTTPLPSPPKKRRVDTTPKPPTADGLRGQVEPREDEGVNLVRYETQVS